MTPKAASGNELTLREVERILRNSCFGRVPDDYAKLTAATAMKLADSIAAADKQEDRSKHVGAVVGQLISYLHRELGTESAKQLLEELDKSK